MLDVLIMRPACLLPSCSVERVTVAVTASLPSARTSTAAASKSALELPCKLRGEMGMVILLHLGDILVMLFHREDILVLKVVILDLKGDIQVHKGDIQAHREDIHLVQGDIPRAQLVVSQVPPETTLVPRQKLDIQDQDEVVLQGATLDEATWALHEEGILAEGLTQELLIRWEECGWMEKWHW